jgi:hypothetical protein
MAADSRRQVWLLSILTVVLIGVLWWELLPEPAIAPAASARPSQAASGRRGGAPATGAPVEAVRLDALKTSRTEPDAAPRDPFRFNAPAPPPPKPVAPVTAPGAGAPGSSPLALAQPAGPPPMLLKFIGILKPASTAPIAVLTDGKNVFYGREGETIEGRYRIERIGVESVEMAWADGQGHQVIRLSGS